MATSSPRFSAHADVPQGTDETNANAPPTEGCPITEGFGEEPLSLTEDDGATIAMWRLFARPDRGGPALVLTFTEHSDGVTLVSRTGEYFVGFLESQRLTGPAPPPLQPDPDFPDRFVEHERSSVHFPADAPTCTSSANLRRLRDRLESYSEPPTREDQWETAYHEAIVGGWRWNLESVKGGERIMHDISNPNMMLTSQFDTGHLPLGKWDGRDYMEILSTVRAFLVAAGLPLHRFELRMRGELTLGVNGDRISPIPSLPTIRDDN